MCDKRPVANISEIFRRRTHFMSLTTTFDNAAKILSLVFKLFEKNIVFLITVCFNCCSKISFLLIKRSKLILNVLKFFLQ